MPGLYQNWLLSAVDPTSKIDLSGTNNFVTVSTQVELLEKFDQDLSKPLSGTVINSWVDNENFVWYLCNFLEKTDGVGILIDSLIDDLFSKAKGTVAFDGLLKHFVKTYNLTSTTERAYCYNAAIEYFYFLLCDQYAEFKLKAQHKQEHFINIEYNDFSDKQVLINKLSVLPNFSLTHFENLYQQLKSRNTRYLTKRSTFIKSFLTQGANFDILELAYIGYLISKITKTQLDWFNPSIRETNIAIHKDTICKVLQNMLQ
jgi:hypothetical protein